MNAARAHWAAVQAVQGVREGRGSLDTWLAKSAESLDPKEQSNARLIASLTCRHFYHLQGVFNALVSKPLRDKDQVVETLVLTGLAQMAFSHKAEYAAVKETVSLAPRVKRPWARGFVNGVLRNFGRDKSRWLMHKTGLEALWNHPEWWVNRLQTDYPAQWERILNANNQHPPMTLRVNQRKTTPTAYLEALQKTDIEAQAVEPAGAIQLAKPVPVSALPGFFEGLCSVQDAAAQWCGALLKLNPGDRVLDACSAPGGKTGHLLERYDDLELIACDLSAKRLERTRENLARLGLHAELMAQDAGQLDTAPFDAILLDAPCSGTGVIRRNPDSRIALSPAQIADNEALQSQLLDHLWTLVKPGGQLLYATCSICPSENHHQTAAFLARTADARDATPEIPGTDAQSVGRQRLPGPSGDGFYYALLIKSRA